jgi:hypothetical protein
MRLVPVWSKAECNQRTEESHVGTHAIKADHAKWGRVVKEANIKAE